MRHHYAFALLAAASALLSGCAKEEQIQENIQKSITASIDGNSLTRAAVRNVNIVWTDDDAINAPYHPIQVPPDQGMARHSLLKSGQVETAIVQHHRIDDQASRLLAEQLDPVPVLVDEDEHVAIPQVKRHLVVHDSREHVEALSHVGRLREQPVPHAVVQAKHGPPPRT